VRIWTAQFGYDGQDRVDITRGSAAGVRAFAPSWKLVSGVKDGSLSWGRYTELYLEEMRVSWIDQRKWWARLLRMPSVTLVCYCKFTPEHQCHRFLLADILVQIQQRYGVPVERMGERP